MLNVAFLNCYAECCYAERCYAECPYSDCRYSDCRYAVLEVHLLTQTTFFQCCASNGEDKIDWCKCYKTFSFVND